MGFGDALLQAGIAQDMFALDPSLGPVTMLDCVGEPRWRPEWAGNPAIRQPNQPLTAHALRIGGGCLPYHPPRPGMTWRSRDHRATLYLTGEEVKLGLHVRRDHGRFVLIEPPGRKRPNPNRFWHGWAALATLLAPRLRQAGLALVQLEHPGIIRLPGVPAIKHRDFRQACGILQAAELGVLTEGGITIAAATVGTPAVVLWSAMADVEVVGYPEHVNIVDDDPRTPCGSTQPCQHCADAWARLTPEHVEDVVMATLKEEAA